MGVANPLMSLIQHRKCFSQNNFKLTRVARLTNSKFEIALEKNPDSYSVVAFYDFVALARVLEQIFMPLEGHEAFVPFEGHEDINFCRNLVRLIADSRSCCRTSIKPLASQGARFSG